MDPPITNGSALITVPIRFPAASRREADLESSARPKPEASPCTEETDASEERWLSIGPANIDRCPVDRGSTRNDADAASDDHTVGAEEPGEETGVDKAAHAAEDVLVGKKTDSDSGTKRHAEDDIDGDRHDADGSEVDRKV